MNQFYSMILYKAEILKYVKSYDDPAFKRFIIQFFSEETKDGVNYKMRGWVLQKDLSAYPKEGNLLAEGKVVSADIKSAIYFANCELTSEEFKKDILDNAGGLKGDWDLITLTPLQNEDGYLFVELSVALPTLDTVKTVANPRPPYNP